jgi:biopolymer transport protein ExbB/TolQ
MNPAPADPILTLVAADHRLNGLAVFTHAKPIVMLVMALLLLTIPAAIALWARALGRGRSAEAAGPAMAKLAGIAAAAPLLGFFAAAYGLMDSCIGLANVRPVPSLSILAPGLAEAFLAISLGLLAAAVATIGRHHLQARGFASPATEPERASGAAAPLARAAWSG